MSTLIASLSTGKGTWGHVSRLIKENKWDNILLITNEFGKENFTKSDNTELILIDANKGIEELSKDIYEKLKDKIKDPEVALNLVSGSGKEHMAIISSILKLGIGLRLIALTNEGMKEI